MSRSTRVCSGAAAFLIACGGGDARDDVAARDAVDSVVTEAVPLFAASLDVDLTAMTETAGGVWYRDVRPGRGAVAEPGSSVTVAYRAWLPDGTLYEERPSAEGWGPAEFVLADGTAPVPGLVEGMSGMRTGGVRRIVVPPEHGYGLIGRPSGVPANSMLVFEVTLRNVH